MGASNDRTETYISPSIVLLIQIKHLRVIRARLVRAVLARSRCIGILNIARVGREKVCHVPAAGLAHGGVKRGKLLGRALDLDVPNDCAQEAADEVVEGVEVVEPVFPEGLHGRVRHDDAAEGDQAAADE